MRRELGISGRAIALIELRSVLRNRTARYYGVTVQLFILMATGMGLLLPLPDVQRVDLIYTAAVFAPLTYGTLAFSWNATNAAPLFYLPFEPDDLLLGRLLAAAALSVPAVLVLTGVAAVLAPKLLVLPAAATLAAISLFALPSILVSIAVPRNLDANAPPFSDLKRFGWQHFAAVIPALIPAYAGARWLPYEWFVGLLVAASVAAAAAWPFAFRFASDAVHRALPKLSHQLLEM